MFLISLIVAIIVVYLPIVSNNTTTVAHNTTVTGSTFTYTTGATCVIRQSETVQTVVSDEKGWCDYQLTPNALFTVEVQETSDNPLYPGAVWSFTCTAASTGEEYPQNIYGVGCLR